MSTIFYDGYCSINILNASLNCSQLNSSIFITCPSLFPTYISNGIIQNLHEKARQKLPCKAFLMRYQWFYMLFEMHLLQLIWWFITLNSL